MVVLNSDASGALASGVTVLMSPWSGIARMAEVMVTTRSAERVVQTAMAVMVSLRIRRALLRHRLAASVR